MIHYQTDAKEIAENEISTSVNNSSNKESYKYNSAPFIFNDLSLEEKISKEEEVKFYKKVFETKNL